MALNVYVFVYVHVYVYVYVNAYVYVCVCMRAFASTNAYILGRSHLSMHTLRVHERVRTDSLLYAYPRTYTYAYTRAYMHAYALPHAHILTSIRIFYATMNAYAQAH